MERIINLPPRRSFLTRYESKRRCSGNRDKVFIPDNRAIDKLLDVGDDVLPNTIELLKNPLYATALNDFAQTIPSDSPFAGMSDEQLFDSVNSDKDLNNNFWSFIDSAKSYKIARSKKS